MVSGIISAEDFIAAARLDRIRTAVPLRIWTTAFVLFGWFMSTSREQHSAGLAILTLGVVVLGFELYFSYLHLPRLVRKRIFDLPEMQGETSYEWDRETLHAWNRVSDSKRPWKDFKGFKENKRLLLLYMADGVYQVFPKRWFNDPQTLVQIKSFVNDTRI